MFTKSLIILSLAACLSACGSGTKDAPAKETTLPMLLVAEDLVEISATRIVTGPIISGSLQAKKQADLRAEVSAIVLQVLKDNGDQVKKGDLLARLDDNTFRQALNSAQEAERAAQQNFDQAERQFNRLKTLVTSGAVSTQAKEDAELRRNTAQSDLAAARTRVVQDLQQLTRTEVRAPFAGIVSNREASNGDTAQIGKALIKVIDPESIYFAGFVSSDQALDVKVGQQVNFRINGYRDHIFQGHIERVNPVADSSTRQVGVQVAVDNKKQDGSEKQNGDNKNLTVGMFAEGRVQTETTQGLTIPEASLVQQGDHTYVWRVQKNHLKKVEIKLGVRDVQTGDYSIVTGLAQGDTIIRHPRGALVDGAEVKMEKADGVNLNADKMSTTKQEG